MSRAIKRDLACIGILLLWCIAPASWAADVEAALAEFQATGDFAAVWSQVAESREFYGLASYYNAMSLNRMRGQAIELLAPGETTQLVAGEKLAAVGRFNVLLVESPIANLEVGEETFLVVSPLPLPGSARIVRKDQLRDINSDLDQLRYFHLWKPLAVLSRSVEWSLVKLQTLTGLGWGLSIVLFTVLLKILMLPLGIFSARLQSEVSEVQSKLGPRLAEIKSKYDGEEAHKLVMEAHKELGVSTFFALKPMLGMFVQVPIWIAVFNALGEMPQLNHQAFLWIQNLAYPDSIAQLPTALPLIGDSVSLLPLLMAAVTIVSALLLREKGAPAEQLRSQKRNAYLTGFAFLILFYPFPAAMVLYWTLSNTLQIVQQQLMKS